ncbi:MAG TPA: DUF4252 domain-containing protein [Gammaproteobacteria bacterium]
MALAGWLLCAPWAGALAQGFFDFDSVPGLPDAPTVQIDLNGALLAFVSGATRAAGDAETADMLRGLEGVRLRVYESLEDADAVNAFVDDASGRLEREGWQRVVYVQEGGEKVRVYARMEGEQVNGLTLMVVDAAEAVFMNVAGPLDPEQLGRLAGAVGVGDVIGELAGGQAGASGGEGEE